MLNRIELQEMGRVLELTQLDDDRDVVVCRWRGESVLFVTFETGKAYRLDAARGGPRFWSSLDRLVKILDHHGVPAFRVVAVPHDSFGAQWDDDQRSLYEIGSEALG